MAETVDIIPILWQPQPKQLLALQCPYDELFYGGAKYVGKSDFLLMDFYKQANKYGKSARGIIFRRSYNELEELIYRSKELYRDAAYSETKKTWGFRNGAALKMRFLESDQDVGRYQGHQYSWIGFDELTEWPTDYCYIFMLSCLRSPLGVPCRMRSSGNPGRIGHLWVKARFIEPAPAMTPIVEKLETPNGPMNLTRAFIPALLDDNVKGVEKDPLYEARLKLLPPHLYEAFRHGNWDIIAGAAFSELRREIHSIDVSNPPERLLQVFDFDRMTPKEGINIFRSMDWGYAKPFAVLWGFSDYDGRMYIYRELYGCKGPDEGIQMPARDVARKIIEIEKEHSEKVIFSIADASIWDKPSNQNERAEKLPSIAETMAEEHVFFDREISIDAKKSRLQGKHQIHERLRIDADGLPHLFMFSTCIHGWRTVPALPMDDLNPEDVDSSAEDHWYDSLRYLVSARPMKSTVKKPEVKRYSVAWFYRRQEERNAQNRY